MSTIIETSLPVGAASSPVVDRAHVAVIIPTYNARAYWSTFQKALRSQKFPSKQILIVDSDSEDGTAELAEFEGYQVKRIARRAFNHGGTRQMATSLVPWATVVVYLTQDAVLATPDAIDLLLTAFDDPRVGAAYGRQLPRPGSGAIEAHARLFNYPPRSEVRDFESRQTLGIKAAFLSNSFAAYRVSALQDVGGFPTDVILAEDALVTGKMLIAGWKAAYVAEAQVFHSHSFTIAEEFRRYFDIGICHGRASWLRLQFGKPNCEGRRFFFSELAYLVYNRPYLIPSAMLRTCFKALGYELGLREASLGRKWARKLSFHKAFWDDS